MFIHRHLFLSKRFVRCRCESLNRSYTGALTDHKGLIYFPDSDLSRLQTEQADDVVLVIDAFPDLTSLYVCFERPRTNYMLGRCNHLYNYCTCCWQLTHFLRPHTSSGERDEPPHGSALLARQNCRWEAMHVADEMNFPPQESLTPRNTLQGKTSDAWWFEVRNFKALTRRHSRRQSEASAPAALLDRMFSSVLNHIYIPVITLLSFCAVVWSSRRWNTNSELVFCAAWSKLFDPQC